MTYTYKWVHTNDQTDVCLAPSTSVYISLSRSSTSIYYKSITFGDVYVNIVVNVRGMYLNVVVSIVVIFAPKIRAHPVLTELILTCCCSTETLVVRYKNNMFARQSMMSGKYTGASLLFHVHSVSFDPGDRSVIAVAAIVRILICESLSNQVRTVSLSRDFHFP